jgi:hypothetical protein
VLIELSPPDPPNLHVNPLGCWFLTVGPQTLVDHFQALTTAERYTFISLLVPVLRLNEALSLSRQIEPRMKRDFLRDLPGELALHCLSFVSFDVLVVVQANNGNWPRFA